MQTERMHASAQERSSLAGRSPGALVAGMNVSVQGTLAVIRVNHTATAGLNYSGGLALTGHQVPTKAALPLPASTGYGIENITEGL